MDNWTGNYGYNWKLEQKGFFLAERELNLMNLVLSIVSVLTTEMES